MIGSTASHPLSAAPWWLPGGNTQTIWPALAAKRFEGAAPRFRRLRAASPDDDFLDFDFCDASAQASTLLVLFHGLEGSSSSHYAQAFAHVAHSQGMACVVPHFRGCSGEMNRAPRSYHCGDWQEIDWILRSLRAGFGQTAAPQKLIAVGVSLGGNALMRWAGQMGADAANVADAVCSISSPLDMASAGVAIDTGFNKAVYARMFLNSMKPNAAAKWAQHPGLFDLQRTNRATTLREFDDAYTSRVHGFADVDDYYARASAKPWLKQVSIPSLCINAVNDPFVPAHGLPMPADVSPHVSLWQPAHGGHVGFPTGSYPTEVMSLPRAVIAKLLAARP
jgi:predicted alpha/beta-fold hydrolase